MSLPLSASGMRNLSCAVETLLSPLAYPSTETWCKAVNASLRSLFEADHAVFALPGDKRLSWHSSELDRRALSPFAMHLAQDCDSGLVRAVSDPVLKLWLKRRRAQAVEVHTQAINDQLVDDRWSGCTFFKEAFVAAGMRDCFGLMTAASIGETLIILSYDRAAPSHVSDIQIPLLHVLLPAFRGGLRALNTIRSRWIELTTTIDSVAQPMLVIAANGTSVHRNAAFSRMLLSEPERDRLVHAASEVGARLLNSHGCCDIGALTPPPFCEITTATTRYMVSATYFNDCEWRTGGTALVTVDRRHPDSPHSQALNTRFGLTERESVVAHALARRLSNAELARALGISCHTARRHTERVLSKVGVHSRRELASRLAEAPHSPEYGA